MGSEIDYRELNKELKESIQKEVGKMNAIDFDMIKLPPFKENFDERTIEELTNHVIEKIATQGNDALLDLSSKDKRISVKNELLKKSYERRCEELKEYIKKYYESAYILRRDNLRKIYDEEYSKLLD